MLDTEEFLFLLQSLEGSPPNYWSLYEEASNQNNLDQLLAIYHATKGATDPLNVVLNAMALARYEAMKSFSDKGIVEHANISPKNKDTITSYLNKIQTWTLKEIQIYTNTMGYLSLEQQRIYFKNALKKIDHYRHFAWGKKIYAILLINSCGNFIAHEDFALATECVAHLDTLTEGTESAIYRLYQRYFEQLIRYCLSQSEKSEAHILSVISTLESLDYVFLSQQCLSFFKQIKNKKSNTRG
ncbi:Rgg/GadR/MutR family transcriptional regulator [Enterococcus sp. DIV0876]|uniref:Rgg family transcriptional regulator n=1 Tax=Enterococcus sp. DIV0876 TaxID=2774633 RepID=UPI003D3011A2